jgi:predicted GNAT family N-acyltransferase
MLQLLSIHSISTDQELEQAYRVRHTVFVEEQGVDPALEMDEHESTAVHFLAQWEGEPIGAARYRRIAPDTAKVERVAVLPAYRGKQIGVQLMQAIEAHAREAGLAQLKLNAQRHAEVFYTRLGYEPYGAPFEEAGIAHVAMRKSL